MAVPELMLAAPDALALLAVLPAQAVMRTLVVPS